MSDSISNAKLDALVAQYRPDPAARDVALLHLACVPAIMFSLLGMLFAINFGVSLIAVALTILYYYRFGHALAAVMGAALLAMLAVWMMLMPAHHLVAESIGIFLAALAGERTGSGNASRSGRSLTWCGRRILAAPAYTLVMLRNRLLKQPAT